MTTIWHDRLAVEPCKVVIWYDHFWLAGAQCCFDSPKCVVQATLFFQVMSVGSLVACAFVCAFRLYVFIVPIHSGLGPDCIAFCCEKVAFVFAHLFWSS